MLTYDAQSPLYSVPDLARKTEAVKADGRCERLGKEDTRACSDGRSYQVAHSERCGRVPQFAMTAIVAREGLDAGEDEIRSGGVDWRVVTGEFVLAKLHRRP